MENDSKKLKMICFIKNYDVWDDIFNAHVLAFQADYGVYPNIALGSKDTWEKIDDVANRNNPDSIMIDAEDFEIIDCSGEQAISNFMTSDYCLEFCLDENVKEDYIILVFDEDPDFDGERSDAEGYRRIA